MNSFLQRYSLVFENSSNILPGYFLLMLFLRLPAVLKTETQGCFRCRPPGDRSLGSAPMFDLSYSSRRRLVPKESFYIWRCCRTNYTSARGKHILLPNILILNLMALGTVPSLRRRVCSRRVRHYQMLEQTLVQTSNSNIYLGFQTNCHLSNCKALENTPCACAANLVSTVSLQYWLDFPVQSFPVSLLMTFSFVVVVLNISSYYYFKSKVSHSMSQRCLTELRIFFARTCRKISNDN